MEKGADINATDKAGNTALLLSASNGHLHQQGADINTTNKYGDTALMVSAYASYTAYVKYLIEL